MEHRKYGYVGVIAKADRVCLAPEDWIRQMGVDGLPGHGRNQPFYRVLVDERHRPGQQETYVAQENIKVLGDRVMADDERVVSQFTGGFDEGAGEYVV